jgi:beta-mannosidase
VLNGRPIFSRGSCWIPASSFVAALGEAEYRPLIESMADGAHNMVRIWGGGVYEHDAFYDLCDEVGVLVWQDFMFACAPYPEDNPAFVDSVAEEVRYQIKRLRNHPSVALWCGNNENQMMQDFQRRPDVPEKPFLGARYYDEIIPEAVAALDPTTPYWPGSPAGGPHANSMLAGDVHDWTVWHGLPPVPVDRPVGRPNATPEGKAYTRYAEDMSRFVSEYGLHASPALETLKRAIPEADLYYGSPALEHRIKDNPKDKVNTLLLTSTGLPGDLQQYVDFTQIMQAEGLKFGIEHFRRRMPHCAGSLIWQYNDCWPCVSWSLMDYNGFAKAGWFYTRRAYAPVLASFKDLDDGRVELWITNEGLDDLADDVTIDLVDLNTGAVVAQDHVAARVAMNVSRAVWALPGAWPAPAPSLALHVRSGSGAFPDNRIFFGAIKDVQKPAGVKVEADIVQRGPHELEVTVSASSYAYFTHLLVPHGWTRFSDNYFDLRPGERRVITVSNAGVALRPEDVVVRSV